MLVRFDVGFDVGFDVRLRVLLQNCRTDAHEGVNEGAQGCKLECCVAGWRIRVLCGRASKLNVVQGYECCVTGLRVVCGRAASLSGVWQDCEFECCVAGL